MGATCRAARLHARRASVIRSQLRAGRGKLSLASLAVFALDPLSAVSADGDAPHSLHMLRLYFE